MRNKDKLDFINQIVEEAEKQCDIQDVVKRYRVEAISINKKHLFNEEIEGLENASEVYLDLKIEYYETYTSVVMTEL